LALALYTLLLVRNIGAVAGGSDSSGYLNHARLLASGTVHVPPRTIPGLPQSSAPPNLYAPLGFKPAWDGNGLVPTYPVGLPLLILLMKPIAGWGHAADLTMILHSLAGIVATFALGRMLGLQKPWALFGALIVAASPLYLFLSLQTMSDVPSMFWTTAAMLAALRCRDDRLLALAAGGAFAVDALLRPTNVLALVPLCFALGASPRRLVLFMLGCLPGAVFFACHSMAAYGSPFTTGYGQVCNFGAAFVPETLLHYALWIPALFTPIAVLCLGLTFDRGEDARTRRLLLSWIAVFAGFYSAYGCTHETWWYLRYLLPAAPALVVGSLLVGRKLISLLSRKVSSGAARAACAAAIACVVINSFWWTRKLHAIEIGRGERKYGLVADWMTKNLPTDAVCLSTQMSGAMFYYTNFSLIRCEPLKPGDLASVETAIRTSKRPLYAVLFPYEIKDWDVLGKIMPGDWEAVGNVDDVTIWKREF
jgi:hypothetical protein